MMSNSSLRRRAATCRIPTIIPLSISASAGARSSTSRRQAPIPSICARSCAKATGRLSETWIYQYFPEG